MYHWTEAEVEAIVGLLVRCVTTADDERQVCARLLDELGVVLRARHWRFVRKPFQAATEPQSAIVIHAQSNSFACLVHEGSVDHSAVDDPPIQTVPDQPPSGQVTAEYCYCAGQDSLHPLITCRWVDTQNQSCMLSYARTAGEASFSERDQAILRVVTHQLDVVTAGKATIQTRPRPSDLSKRQREVLELLLVGKNCKQIASELRLSAYTVNDYIKALYKRYDVSSRAELLAAIHVGV